MVKLNLLIKFIWLLKNLLDWLERSITQIDHFSRQHRGMLENEKVEEYFTSGNTKTENENEDEGYNKSSLLILINQILL